MSGSYLSKDHETNNDSDQARTLLDCKEKLFFQLFENAPLGIVIIDKEGNVLMVNPAARELLGFPPGEPITAINIFNFQPAATAGISGTIYNSLATGQKQLTEGFYESVRDKAIYIRLHINPIKDETNEILGAQLLFENIAGHKPEERQQAMGFERKLQEQLNILQKLIDNIPKPVFYKDTNGIYKGCNRSFEHIVGLSRDKIVGTSVYDIYPRELADLYQQKDVEIISGLSPQMYESYIITARGERRDVLINKAIYTDLDGTFAGIVGVVTDITERKQIENQIARLERLNLVGEMAAGIGHEIRNPMTAVRGFLQLLGEKAECYKYKGYFNLMIDELDRANSIITEFLSLAKGKPVSLKMMNLNSIIRIMFPLIRAEAMVSDKNAVIDLQDIPDLLMDEKEIRQLILNLVRNGLDAMKAGKTLTIKTCCNDGEVVLIIKDQGKGIEPAHLEKLGTPFFTTKEMGTGLGLAICYSIAARHNACIELETGPGGTTFFVKFSIN